MCKEDRRSSFPLARSIAVEMVFLKIPSFHKGTYLTAIELNTRETVQVFRTDIR
jgi:hypothetical protein